ncbi:MAG TPA: S8 family serine peptidase [Thermoanaerobaculia bacterium]|nr:S8 family serine peptidase [Thermoanaerobaculia bacterium]
MRWKALVCLLLFASLPSSAADTPPTPSIDSSTMASLVLKAQKSGTVHVIARLQLETPFAPLGVLNSSAEVAQRESIRRAADEIAAAFERPSRPVKRFETIPFIALELTADDLVRLASRSDILAIEEDVAVPPDLASSNRVIGSPTAWGAGVTGAGQTIAILDTGVASTHPYFNTGMNKVVSEACYSTTGSNSKSLCPGGVSASTAAGSGVNCTAGVSGCNHGTHVAGIAAGDDNAGPNFGVARGANIIAIQVFSQFDSTADCRTSSVPCALTFTSDQIRGLERVLALRSTFRIAAANMSLGGSRYTSAAACDTDNASRKAIIDNLRSAGIATVISSGNSSYVDAMGAPGCISTAISVGATTDAAAIANFSNIASWTSLIAPGVSITSSVPGGGTSALQGTSMSAPHVAGAWALMRQAYPTADVTTILNTLRNTATLVNDTRTGGTVTGLRRINVGTAVVSTVTISATDNTATEAGTTTGTYTITRTAPATNPLVVRFTVGGTATSGSDYNALGATVTIAAGATTATLVVRPINDSTVEPNETVIVTVAPVPTYQVGSASSATVTITSDDSA